MRFVDNNNITDPRINLAIEEHLLRNVSASSLLLFYVNEPSVIIGRNQNTLEEIDPDFVKENGIHVVRRLSGGGAVYHDLGNLNFSFITSESLNLHNFSKFIEPMVDVLKELGIEAELQGKSDIFLDGKKISGNAQFSSKGRMFSHGTILFDTDIENMLRAINPRQVEIESNAVQSIRRFVTNIREHLNEDMTLAQLKESILRGVFGSYQPPVYQLTDEDWAKIEEIKASRYDSWDWNVGRSPEFNVRKSVEHARIKINAFLQIKDGRIADVQFEGNFPAAREVSEVTEYLIGTRYEIEDVTNAIARLDIAPYFGDIEKETFVSLIY